MPSRGGAEPGNKCTAAALIGHRGTEMEPFDERRYQTAVLESLGRQPLRHARRDRRTRTSYPDERAARQGREQRFLVLHRDRQSLGGRRTGHGAICGQGSRPVRLHFGNAGARK